MGAWTTTPYQTFLQLGFGQCDVSPTCRLQTSFLPLCVGETWFAMTNPYSPFTDPGIASFPHAHTLPSSFSQALVELLPKQTSLLSILHRITGHHHAKPDGDRAAQQKCSHDQKGSTEVGSGESSSIKATRYPPTFQPESSSPPPPSPPPQLTFISLLNLNKKF